MADGDGRLWQQDRRDRILIAEYQKTQDSAEHHDNPSLDRGRVNFERNGRDCHVGIEAPFGIRTCSGFHLSFTRHYFKCPIVFLRLQLRFNSKSEIWPLQSYRERVGNGATSGNGCDPSTGSGLHFKYGVPHWLPRLAFVGDSPPYSTLDQRLLNYRDLLSGLYLVGSESTCRP